MTMSNHDDEPSPPVLPATAPEDATSGLLNRRRFIGGFGAMGAGAALAVGAGGALLSLAEGSAAAAPDEQAAASATRRRQAYQLRAEAARAEFRVIPPRQTNNGDDALYPTHIGSHSKALPHNGFGEVDEAAWGSLMRALDSGDPEDFEAIKLGGARLLTNPQSGLAFDLEGGDAFAFSIPPPPALASAEEAGEMVELYWMALLRDVNFADYASDPDVAAACADLNALTVFKGPRQNEQVRPQTLFRDNVAGGTVGPYISQFMWLPTPFGAEFVDRRMRTFAAAADQMTSFADWLTVQDGGVPPGSLQFDTQRRYIRNGRDIAAWVHMDVLYQAYFNAGLLMLTPPNAVDAESGGIGCPLNPTNPYNKSRTQTGFGTFGGPWVAGLMTEVATRALKATWRQKWFVHRRLRPEEFGGRVHVQKSFNRYPGLLHADVINAPVLDRISGKFGSFLQPQAFPEGCPTHPSYTAGHATVAGACVTVLKAIFDETFVIQHPVVPDPDGLSLVPYSGATLTAGGELNKLASNIATGRNIAGVHWRTDAAVSLALGEQVAIRFLRDTKTTYNELRGGLFTGFSFTAFDGSRVTI
jgi:hypothetical protein